MTIRLCIFCSKYCTFSLNSMSWTISVPIHRDLPYSDSSMVLYVISKHNLILSLLLNISLSPVVSYYKQCYLTIFIQIPWYSFLSISVYFLKWDCSKDMYISVWFLFYFILVLDQSHTDRIVASTIQRTEFVGVCFLQINAITKNEYLHGHGTKTKIRMLTLIHHYHQFLRLHSSFSKCPNNVIFRKRIYFRTRHCI